MAPRVTCALNEYDVSLRSMRRNTIVLVAALAFVAFAPVSATATKASRTPRVVGLTLTRARVAVRHAGCRITLRGAAVSDPAVQTIRRQARAGEGASRVLIWLNQLCSTPAHLGGPRGEPILRHGPAELITGLYLVGGPPVLRSAPSCARLEGTTSAGRVIVRDEVGTVVAARAVPQGELATITLAPGRYTLTGIFSDVIIGGQHATIRESIAIAPAMSVRQDIDVSVP
jgi:hypothetical protein